MGVFLKRAGRKEHMVAYTADRVWIDRLTKNELRIHLAKARAELDAVRTELGKLSEANQRLIVSERRLTRTLNAIRAVIAIEVGQ